MRSISKEINDIKNNLINLKLEKLEKLKSMKNLKSIVPLLIISLSFPVMGCSTNSEANSTRALFDNREEALKAAKNFNCTGAHQMGNKWMPCESHDAHEKGEKHGKHSGHKHHH